MHKTMIMTQTGSSNSESFDVFSVDNSVHKKIALSFF